MSNAVKTSDLNNNIFFTASYFVGKIFVIYEPIFSENVSKVGVFRPMVTNEIFKRCELECIIIIEMCKLGRNRLSGGPFEVMRIEKARKKAPD